MTGSSYRRRWFTSVDAQVRARLVRMLFFTCTLAAATAAPAFGQVKEKYTAVPGSDAPSAFTLTAAGPIAFSQVNESVCTVINYGSICNDAVSAPYPVALLWPQDTWNNYMFEAGPQITGIIRAGDGCSLENRSSSNTPDCFAWSGDTTGAYAVTHGVLGHTTALADAFDSSGGWLGGPWPGTTPLPDFPFVSAHVDDEDIFHEALIGREAASEQDTWTAYWDGDPRRQAGRTHPLGILVEQRTLAWNYPAGNEATIYVVYRITNVTGLQQFQTLSEEHFFDGEDRLPDEGWALDSLYLSFFADPDVGLSYSLNHLTASTPFDMMLAYHTRFTDNIFTFPYAQFHPPFLRGVGMVGMKFLRTPEDPVTGLEQGMTSVNALTGGGVPPTATTVERAWRYASLRLSPEAGDPACISPDAVSLRWCSLLQTTHDAKGIMATGPFSLEPGESETIVMALIPAATVETPLLEVGGAAINPPGLPTLASGCNGEPIRDIEVGAGWISSPVCPAPGERIEQRTVEVVPGSLLGKAQVAQALADNRFIMPAAPEPPPFHLVPGPDRVTVVWEPSATEQSGDPFYPIASDASSILYDPNFRRNDVEGYRIYRGLSPDDMQLVAQFDRSGTVFTDALCRTDPTHIKGSECDEVREIALDDDLVQYRTVAPLAEGTPLVMDADTALAAAIREGRGVPLRDNGVPFAFVDDGVRSGFNYFYRVTAFDINSLKSGPSSFESTSAVKQAMPRSLASSRLNADVDLGLYGRSALELRPPPSIDPQTGTFTGPQPPTSQFAGDLTVIAGELLAEGASEIRIDSIIPGYYPNGTIATYHLSVDGRHATVRFTNRTTQASPGGTESFELPVLTIASSPELREEFGQRAVDTPPVAAHLSATISVDRPHWNSLHSNWAYKQPGFWYSDVADPPETGWAGGSRWFSGASETMPDPTGDVVSHGSLDGIAAIFQPTPYLGLEAPAGEERSTASPMAPYRGLSENVFRRFYGTVLGVTRAADVRLYWGAAGLDSVIDVTHDVPVPFSTAVRASYGFLTDADEDGVLTYGDFYYLEGLETSPANEIDEFARAARPLAPQPVVAPVDANGDLVADGAGFGLYINGEPYLFLGTPSPDDTWTLRTYDGAVARADNGTYSFTATGGNPAVPGLRMVAVVNRTGDIAGMAPDLTRVHTVPDPYYSGSIFDRSPEFKQLQFVNLPAQATVRIYTVSGVLVDVIVHDDPAGYGTASWDLRGRGNHRVASGVYLFHVSTPDGREHVGRFTVVSSGW